MMVEIRCSCGKGTLTPREYVHCDVGSVVGPFNPGEVLAENVRALVCSACSEVTFSGEELDAMSSQLMRIIVSRGERLRPREVAFLRGELGMTQAELAERLGVTRITVARWESEDGEIGRAPSFTIRALVARQRGETKLLNEIAAAKRAETRTELPYTLH